MQTYGGLALLPLLILKESFRLGLTLPYACVLQDHHYRFSFITNMLYFTYSLLN